MNPRSKHRVPAVGRSQPAILMVLCLIAVAMLFNRMKPVTASAASPRIVEAQHPKDDWKPQENIEWPFELRRDPFATKAVVAIVEAAPNIEPPPMPAQPNPEVIARNARTNFRVGGILYSKQPKTLLNGELCVEGDVVDGYRIHRIERNAIVIEKDGILVTISP